MSHLIIGGIRLLLWSGQVVVDVDVRAGDPAVLLDQCQPDAAAVVVALEPNSIG